MSLNIKNPDVTRLVNQLSAARRESKTETIRVALEQLRAREALPPHDERQRELDALLDEVHAKLPPEAQVPWTRDDYDALYAD